jgi:hypothetical protein
MHVTLSPHSGLITARSLLHLHRLQLVAREFFQKHRARPTKEARAFSMALAAVELPPLSSTTARLVASTTSGARVQVIHEVLAHSALRFALTLEQGSRGPITVGKDKLCRVGNSLALTLKSAGAGSAGDALIAVSSLDGVKVVEVVRGELGPVVWGPAVACLDGAPAPHALQSLCSTADDAILSVTLQRLAADVAQRSMRDPWPPPVIEPAGFKLAHERRLFSTASVAEPLSALVGRQVVVRSA